MNIEEIIKTADIYAKQINDYVETFRIYNTKHEKFKFASSIQALTELFCNLNNAGLGEGISLIDDNWVNEFGSVEIDNEGVTEALNYLWDQNDKERDRVNKREYAKWVKENCNS